MSVGRVGSIWQAQGLPTNPFYFVGAKAVMIIEILKPFQLKWRV